jgi:hypothetical protein
LASTCDGGTPEHMSAAEQTVGTAQDARRAPCALACLKAAAQRGCAVLQAHRSNCPAALAFCTLQKRMLLAD